ncbi:unnamed protein product [Boreogadus saida]
MTTLPFPCPVRLGVMKSEGLEEQLHRYTMEKNLTKTEKLLRKGVDVDCINHLGQTPLFCAALLGHGAVSELLLQYRADPNHRCKDLSTPVHAAVFSGNARLLSGLLDSGGDIRLHDQEGRVPVDWFNSSTRRATTTTTKAYVQQLSALALERCVWTDPASHWVCWHLFH